MKPETTKIIEEFLKNPWVILIGYIATIVALFLAIFFYFKSKKEKNPLYTINSKRLIKDFSSNFNLLKIKYGDNPISNFTVSNITFWNDGKEVIDRSDITIAEPLMIKINNGGIILDAEIIYKSTKSNQFSLRQLENQNCVLLEFDYLGKDDGAVIQILHDATNSDDIIVCGTLKGFGKINRDKKNNPIYIIVDNIIRSTFISLHLKKRIVGYTSIILTLFFWIMAIFKEDVYYLNQLDKLPLWFVPILVSFTYLPIAYYTLRRNVPKKFNISDKEKYYS